MPDDGLTERLEREPEKVECPLCRHRQWFAVATGRCDQCGSEVRLFAESETARRELAALSDAGRLAYLAETDGGLFAVIANRTFGRPGA